MEAAPKEKMLLERALRDAFGVPNDFVLAEEEIAGLHYHFQHIVPYFIFFTARSGSTFLTHELRGTSVLSCPHEWFNPGIIAKTNMKEKFSFPEYTKNTVEKNVSKNGVFGSEIHWIALIALNAIVPVEKIFPNKIRWFYLRRRNLVAQAISHFIAVQSRIFHSYQLTETGLEAIRVVKYDAELIKLEIIKILHQEANFEGWLRSFHVEPVRIYYEELIEDPKKVSKLFANVMNVCLPEEYLKKTDGNPVKKIGSNRNSDFEQKFRSEESGFLLNALDRRPLALYPLRSI
jgi:LPS sulfotransferase NodH